MATYRFVTSETPPLPAIATLAEQHPRLTMAFTYYVWGTDFSGFSAYGNGRIAGEFSSGGVVYVFTDGFVGQSLAEAIADMEDCLVDLWEVPTIVSLRPPSDLSDALAKNPSWSSEELVAMGDGVAASLWITTADRQHWLRERLLNNPRSFDSRFTKAPEAGIESDRALLAVVHDAWSMRSRLKPEHRSNLRLFLTAWTQRCVIEEATRGAITDLSDFDDLMKRLGDDLERQDATSRCCGDSAYWGGSSGGWVEDGLACDCW